MPAYSVQETLECAIQETLDELVPEDIDCSWHLAAATILRTCDGSAHGEGEEHEPHLSADLAWRLNMHISRAATPEEQAEALQSEEPPICKEHPDAPVYRASDLSGTLAYVVCSDGDVDPMIHLTKSMWDYYRFGEVMSSEDLDIGLQQIVEEIERGSGG